MIDPGNGRVVTCYVSPGRQGVNVKAFDADFRSCIGWAENRHWMLIEIGAHSEGNEASGFATVAEGARSVATGHFSFGQLGFDAAGTAGAGFSRHAIRPLRIRLSADWDGILRGTPKLWLDGGLVSQWQSNADPVVWLSIQRLVQRQPRR